MSALTSLQARVARYLVERRRLGFSDHSQTYALRSFARHVQAVSHRGPLTVEVMGDWSDAARISPLLATLFLGCMGFTILGGAFFFVAPAAFSAAVAICLALAFNSARSG